MYSSIISINYFSEFPTCCARLRCVVEVNGERIVQTRGQPGELFPDKYDIIDTSLIYFLVEMTYNNHLS